MTHTSHIDESPDVIVVGAGFAGLAAAQVLGRAQKRVLVLGHGPTRNAEAQHAHNVLTRDGTPPADLLAMAVQEVAALPSVTILDAQVTDIAVGAPQDGAPHDGAAHAGADRGRVRVTATDGSTWSAAHVVLATGARDALPGVPGLPHLWGRRAHSCPFCDAEQYAGRRLLVLADEPAGAHLRTMLSGWTSHLTVMDPAAIAHLVEEGEHVLATTTHGEVLQVDGVFARTTPLPRLDAVATTPLAHRGPFLATDGVGRTSETGLWAVGDCAWADGQVMPGGMVIAAMADGARAGASIVVELQGIEFPPTPEVTGPTASGRPDAGPAHGHGWPVDDGTTNAEFWAQHYAGGERIWSGLPNVGLTATVAGRTPGTALELGCGEGADAVWLAEQGWTVTAVDISDAALDRGRAAAADRGVADRITWVQADLAEELPAGTWDLVASSYTLSPVAFPRDEILRGAAARVRPGGALLILSHLHLPGGRTAPAPLPTIAEQLDGLGLDEAWTVAKAETFSRGVRMPDGTVGQVGDTVVFATR